MRTNAYSSPSSRNICISMCEYGAYDLTKPDAPDYVTTTEVKNCIVVIIKNINADKQCTHLAFSHLSLSNIFFSGTAKKNINTLLQAFVDQGGTLDNQTSIQLLGGLAGDVNNAKELARSALQTALDERGIAPPIKTPTGYEITDPRQAITIAIDKNGTYMRHFIPGQDPRFNTPMASTILSNENTRNLTVGATEGYNEARQKTSKFHALLGYFIARFAPEATPQTAVKLCREKEAVSPFAATELERHALITPVNRERALG